MYRKLKITELNRISVEEFKEADKYVKNHYYKNVYIVQGDIDRTVLVNDILDFVNKNKLIYKIIENGKHELYGFEEEIVNFIKDKPFDEVVKRVKLLIRMGMLEALDNKRDFRKGVIEDYVEFFNDEHIEDFI